MLHLRTNGGIGDTIQVEIRSLIPEQVNGQHVHGMNFKIPDLQTWEEGVGGL